MVAAILAERLVIEVDVRVRLLLQKPDDIVEYQEVLKDKWDKRKDAFVAAIEEQTKRIGDLKKTFDCHANQDQQQSEDMKKEICEAVEQVKDLVNRIQSVAKKLDKLEDIEQDLSRLEQSMTEHIKSLSATMDSVKANTHELLAGQEKIINILEGVAGTQNVVWTPPDDAKVNLYQTALKASYANQHIDMVLGDARLPLSHMYVQLATVFEAANAKKEKQRLKSGEIAVGSFEEIVSSKKNVILADIFREDRRARTPVSRVLVLGRAGIGKTTLCKKVTYDWATSSFWKKFRFFFAVKYRSMTIDHFAASEPSIAQAIYQEH
eukprot:PhF_6_TR25696/c2_g1_i1/m.36216